MLQLTSHALSRAIERIPGIATIEQARTALTSQAILTAARFGAEYVRLGTGQRIVLEGWSVVTVLPSDHFRRQVRREGLGRYGKTVAAHRRGGGGE